MAGSQATEDDFIFDNTDEDIGGGGDGGSALPNEPGLVQQPEPVDNQAVSQAIRDLIHPQARTAPAPAPELVKPPATPQASQTAEQAPLTPREQAFLAELREERQKRQAAEGRGQQPNGQQPAVAQKSVAQQLFEAPEDFVDGLKRNFAEQVAQVRLEGDLNIASIRHGDTFNEAFQAFIGQVGSGQDKDTYFRVMNAPSPGEEIVKWFKQSSVLREVGEDPAAYRQRLRDEMLNDPEVAAQFAQKFGVQYTAPTTAPEPAPRQADGTFAPKHQVRLPTATGRIPGASRAGAETGEDGSDDAIFDAGRAPRRK